MAETIGRDEIIRMLRGAVEKIRAGRETLSKLDSVIGDGDHGTTMVRAMGLVEKTLAECAAPDLQGLLHDVGWAVMGVDGGAAGPLLGSLLMGMAEGVGGRRQLDAAGVAAVFEAGLAQVRTYTQAQVGDKTMLDALVPAVEALRVAAGDGVAAAMARAADAAEKGAAATTDLQARFGRARNLGERSKGFADPGATSVSLIFRGFADALAAPDVRGKTNQPPA
jgi:dihydroxyacetone kinase-like protein